MASPERNPVEALADEFLNRYRRGEHPSLTEYVRAHPDLADDIRELFPALVMMEELGPGERARSAGADRCLTADGRALERLGDYRILREVGRGGMGVVYEAEQESLGRHVALKVLPARTTTNPLRLQRFRREVRAAARLHHTNIVPVYDVGEENGVHYYAMQFIHGQGLDQVWRELCRLRRPPEPVPEPAARDERLTASLAHGLCTGRFRAGAEAPEPAGEPEGAGPPVRTDETAPADVLSSQSGFSTDSDQHYYRSVARLGLQVAEALAHAHSQRILHRDIKPSNLLLDVHGTVWVTDFGLAKEQGDDLTQTGDVVGTLRYMAPERFHGISDARSDVYSLGLTLYELVTLHTSFEESDRAHLIKKVTHQEPPRPRKLDRRIPRDLETIIQKAMAKEAGRRYPSALALAEDLRRFLADRPIQARRTAAVEQAWRWCRRNPVIASLLGVITLLVLGFSLATAAKNAQLGRALADQEEANRQAMARLWESLRDRARGLRLSRQPGQRLEALRSIREAMQLPLPPGHSLDELRTEAIAALPLVDVEPRRAWSGAPSGTARLAFDWRAEHYVRAELNGTLSVRRVADDGALAVWHEEGFSPAGIRPKCLTLGPGGQYIAVLDAITHVLRVRRCEQSQGVLCHEAHQVSPYAWRVFTPDGSGLVYPCDDGRIAFLELATGQVRYLPDRANDAGCVGVDEAGRRVALVVRSDTQYQLEIRDLASGRLQTRLPLPGRLESFAWHPNGLFVAGVIGPDIHVWDLDSRLLLRRFPARALGIQVAFERRTGLLVSNDWADTLRIWDVFSGDQLLALGAAGYELLHGSLDGAIPTQGIADPFTLRVLGLHASPILRTLRRATGQATAGYAAGAGRALVSPDGRLLAVSSHDADARVRALVLVDLSTGRDVATLPNQDMPAHWDVRQGLTTAGHYGLLRWPVARDPGDAGRLTVGPPLRFLPYASFSMNFGFSADGGVVAIPRLDEGALVWHRERPGRLVSLVPQKEVRYTAVSPDGRWVATGSHTANDGVPVKVWDSETGRLEHAYPGPDLCQVQFSPDGRWLYAPRPGKLWRVGAWEEGVAVGGPEACFTPAGTLMAVESESGAIRLVDPGTGAERARLESSLPTRVIPCCFTPDGMRLVSYRSDTGQLQVWDLAALRNELATLGLEWNEPPLAEKRSLVTASGISVPVRADVALGFVRQAAEAEALITQATELETAGKYAEAVAALRKATKTYAQSAMSHNNLAWLLASGPPAVRDAREAVGEARQAVKLAPQTADYHNTLGVALYRTGQYAEALPVLEKSLALRNGESDAFDLFFLAMCQARLGNRSKAVELSGRALEWLSQRRGELPASWQRELEKIRAETDEVLGLPAGPSPKTP
jgi:serine/threonine protein kinase/WD40 repeat protein/Tfp pilus assembly protein PilF